MHMLLTKGLEMPNCFTARQKEVCKKVPSSFFANWFKVRGRSFPWREKDVSPFGILLAEVLLKQTRAEMVAGVWPALCRKYPDAGSLASASAEVLHRQISCLGFGSQRVTALLRLSTAINKAGSLPTELADLMKLPYVGIYSAHAVACFAFGHRVPVVDLSIVRVLSRMVGIEPPSDIRRAPEVWEIAKTLLPDKGVKEHNYGLLDFAADMCTARRPRCNECPVAPSCAHARYPVSIERQENRLGEL